MAAWAGRIVVCCRTPGNPGEHHPACRRPRVIMTQRVQLIRESRLWRDRFRPYDVLIDDVTLGSVRNGDTSEFVVSPGEHSIRLKVDWCGSFI